MKIDEIFGPTIAGEGSIAGAVTMFIRTGGCDYRCSWCDTWHAVDPVNVPRWAEMTATEAIDRMEEIAPDLAPGTWVSVSGGNPAIWQSELPELVVLLQKRGYKVNIETQGSILNDAFLLAEQVTISPKGPSSGMFVDRDRLRKVIRKTQARGVLKFVIANDIDFTFAKNIAAEHKFTPVYVQPLTEEQFGERRFSGFRYLCERVAADPELSTWRVIPQLHVMAWGNERGH